MNEVNSQNSLVDPDWRWVMHVPGVESRDHKAVEHSASFVG